MASQSASGQTPAPQDPGSPFAANTLSRQYAKLALPMTLGMLLNGLYNIVDGYFIGHHVGTTAFTTISALFPLQLLAIALAAMIANGASILVSRHHGAGNNWRAHPAIPVALVLILILSSVVPLLLWQTKSLWLPLLGVAQEQTASAQAYLFPMLAGQLLLFGLFLISDLLRTIGKMGALLAVILTGALGNVLLDWLLMAVFQWGITGAALATLLAQGMAIATGLYLLGCRPSQWAAWCRQAWSMVNRHGQATASALLALGTPALVGYLGATLITATVTLTLARASDASLLIGAYGMLSRINIFIILPLIAITNSAQTITAYHAGQGNQTKCRQSLKTGLMIATLYLALIAALLQGFPREILGIFSPDARLNEHAATILPVIFLLLPTAGLLPVIIAYLQGIGQAKQAAAWSTVKIYLVLLPMLIAWPWLWARNTLWFAFPLAELLMLPPVIGLLYHQLAHSKNQTTKVTKEIPHG